MNRIQIRNPGVDAFHQAIFSSAPGRPCVLTCRKDSFCGVVLFNILEVMVRCFFFRREGNEKNYRWLVS